MGLKAKAGTPVDVSTKKGTANGAGDKNQGEVAWPSSSSRSRSRPREPVPGRASRSAAAAAGSRRRGGRVTHRLAADAAPQPVP
jgi:hypothetical protein